MHCPTIHNEKVYSVCMQSAVSQCRSVVITRRFSAVVLILLRILDRVEAGKDGRNRPYCKPTLPVPPPPAIRPISSECTVEKFVG